jgi:hypothetical protein
MKSRRLKTFPVLAGVALALGASGVLRAQLEPEEELEIMDLGGPYAEDDAATEDEIFDGLVYDQDAQQYRLIEDPEVEQQENAKSTRRRSAVCSSYIRSRLAARTSWKPTPSPSRLSSYPSSCMASTAPNLPKP